MDEKLFKVCTGCKEEKPITEFYTFVDNKTGKTRRKARCRTCTSSAVTMWKKRNRARTADIQKRYEIKHTHQIKSRRRARHLLEIARLGGKCERCGEWNTEVLSITNGGDRILCQNCRRIV